MENIDGNVISMNSKNAVSEKGVIKDSAAPGDPETQREPALDKKENKFTLEKRIENMEIFLRLGFRYNPDRDHTLLEKEFKKKSRLIIPNFNPSAKPNNQRR